MSEEHDRLMRTVKSIADDAGDMRAKLQFARATDELTSARKKLGDLEQQLGRLRARGFVYKAPLEARLAEATAAAPAAAEALLRESRETGDRLAPRVDKLARRARRRVDEDDLTDRVDEIDVLDNEKDDLEKEIRDAERRVAAQSDPVVAAVRTVEQGIREGEAVLTAFDEGGFDLEPGENPVAAVGASWEDAPGGAQKGVLLLTDARVRFLQDEVIKKGGFLGFGADKTPVKGLRINEPVGHLASSDDTTRGWVFKDQVLAFKWDSAAKVRTTTFEVDKGSAKDWDTLVESLRDGTVATDRWEGAAFEDQVFSFAAECSACSGQLPPAVKGQRTLVCPFCTTVNNPL